MIKEKEEIYEEQLWRHGGIFTESDYKECRSNLEHIIIAPYDTGNVRGVGYNICPTEFIYSIQKKQLLPIFSDGEGTFVYIGRGDTVLTISNEYLKVDDSIAGAFFSKVRNTARGMGNISTTLDPGWNGRLLIALSNPTKRRIKLQITKKNNGIEKNKSIITMLLWHTNALRQDVGIINFHLDNPPMRVDVWDDLTGRPFTRKGYKDFDELLKKINEFKPDKNTETYKEILCVLNYLDELKISIKQRDNITNIRSKIIPLKSIGDRETMHNMPLEIKQKINVLSLMVDKAKSLEELLKDESCNINIELLNRECLYQLLCEEVSQQRKLMRDSVKHKWEGKFWSSLWFNNLYHWLPTIILFFVLILFILFIFQQNILSSVLFSFIICLFETVIDLGVKYFLEAKGKR